MIGDSFEQDACYPRQFGIQGAWFNAAVMQQDIGRELGGRHFAVAEADPDRRRSGGPGGAGVGVRVDAHHAIEEPCHVELGQQVARKIGRLVGAHGQRGAGRLRAFQCVDHAWKRTALVREKRTGGLGNPASPGCWRRRRAAGRLGS
jgi:hypothetical protein